ncbi:MAG: hypothetical protein H6R10_3030 [Rhodocyclaceae bacterium]|nr:hypothetical protein [Rhodocyclaceae bacterium]
MLFAPHRFAPNPANDSFLSLLYRFFFFDWLFADMTQAKGLLECHAARQHNRAMRKYLPTYLRRWGGVAMTAFVAGSVCEQVFQAQLAATCCFTGFSLTLGVMAVIVAAWLLLAAPHRS